MMDKELQEKILTHAKEELYIENIDEFQKELESECYLVSDELLDKVVIASGVNPCVCFDAHSGEYLGLEDKDYAKEVGELL